MTDLRPWAAILIGFLILLGFLLFPKPLTGRPLTTATTELQLSTSSLHLSGEAGPAALSDSASSATAALHDRPGHDCDRCRDTGNLPPWRRRLATKAAEARNRAPADSAGAEF